MSKIPDQETFLEGFVSFEFPEHHSNPYDPEVNFEKHREWQRGFNTGYYENLRTLP